MKRSLLQIAGNAAIWATLQTLFWTAILICVAFLSGGFDAVFGGLLKYWPGIPVSILVLTALMTIAVSLGELQLRHSKSTRKAFRDYLDKEERRRRKRG